MFSRGVGRVNPGGVARLDCASAIPYAGRSGFRSNSRARPGRAGAHCALSLFYCRWDRWKYLFLQENGLSQTYHLTTNATLSIDRFVLTIIYPDTPESMINLNILELDDQRDLLNLLRERWDGTQRLWNPRLGEEIELALMEARHSAVLI